MESGSVSFAQAALLVAVCRGSLSGTAAALAAGASARSRYTREDAQRLLGDEAHLGSQWWATQTDLPVLYFAGKWSHNPQLVRLLLRHGADISATSSLGVTALHMAAQEGAAGVAFSLVEAGANREARDLAGWTALHYCANHRWATWGAAPLDGHIAVVSILTQPCLRPGPSFFTPDAAARLAAAVDDDGATAMHAAAHSGRAELCAALHAAGCPAHAPSGVFSPILLAAGHGRLEVLRVLLSLAPPGATEDGDEHGLTAVGAACASGCAPSILVLASAGCALDSCGAGRLPPLMAASHSACVLTLLTLLTLGCRRGLRAAAAHSGAHARRAADAAAADPAAADAARRACERARAAARLLRQAALGIPLSWSPLAHARYPPAFRRRVRALLLACAAVPGLAALPVPLFEVIVFDGVIAAEARARVWPFIAARDWAVAEEADAVRLARRLPAAEATGDEDEARWEGAVEDVEAEAVHGGEAGSETEGEEAWGEDDESTAWVVTEALGELPL